MTKEKKLFEPIGGFIEKADIDNLALYASKVSEWNDKIGIDTTKLMDEIAKVQEEYNNKFEEILDYLSKFWGKYIHITFYHNSNYFETRETDPCWVKAYEANVMPYQYIKSNDCLFGLFCKLDDDYNAGVVDRSINLLRMVQIHRLEICEITEEEFIEKAHQTIYHCLRSRSDKNESKEYNLTKYGYGYIL